MAMSTDTPINIAPSSDLDMYVVYTGVIYDDNSITEQNDVGEQHRPGELNQGHEVIWCEPVTGFGQQHGPSELDQDHEVIWCAPLTGVDQQHGNYRLEHEPEWFAFGVLPCGYEQQQQHQEPQESHNDDDWVTIDDDNDDDDAEEQHATKGYDVAPYDDDDMNQHHQQYDLKQSSRDTGRTPTYKLRQSDSAQHLHYYVPQHCYKGNGKTALYKIDRPVLSFVQSVAEQVNQYPDWPDYLGRRPGESMTSFFIRRQVEMDAERRRQRKEYIARLQASPFYGPSLITSDLLDEDEDSVTEDANNRGWLGPENEITDTDWQRRSADAFFYESYYHCSEYHIPEEVRTVYRGSKWRRRDTSHFYGRNRAEGRIWVNLVGHGSRGSRARR